MSQMHASSRQHRQSSTSRSGTSQQQMQSTSQQPTQQSGAPTGRMFHTQSYLTEEVRQHSISALNQTLVDLTAVTMQLKDAHWNVKGLHFYQFHQLFEDLIDILEPHLDTVAERASALGGQALATPQDVVQQSSIPPLSHQSTDGQSLITELTHHVAILDANLYRHIQTADDVADLDTADLLNEVSRDVSKALWFLEAHLQGQNGTQGGGTGQ
jgi:starvation-inducible DNA-binding protein